MENESKLLGGTATAPATGAIAVANTENHAMMNTSIFSNMQRFADAQRVAKAFLTSRLIPEAFQGNMGDCLIALEMADRIGASPLAVMQNLYIVHGKPAWSSQFLISCINASGKFSPLRYEMSGKEGTDDYGCVAWAVDLNDKEVLRSPKVTIGMAKAEGWFTKNGSKWRTMPELMLRYRCATLFARLFAPELTMGIQTQDEVIDIQPVVTETRNSKFEKPAVVVEAEPVAAVMADAEVKHEPEKLSDLERLKTIVTERNIPVTAEAIKAYVEQQGGAFVLDDLLPVLDAVVDAVLAGDEK